MYQLKEKIRHQNATLIMGKSTKNQNKLVCNICFRAYVNYFYLIINISFFKSFFFEFYLVKDEFEVFA